MRFKSFFTFLFCVSAAVIGFGWSLASDFAVRTTTSQTGFFRTTQTSDLFSATDGSFTIEFWFKASGPGVLVNEVDAFDIQFWDYSLLELDANGKLLIGLPGIVGVAEVGAVTFETWNHVAIR